MGWVHGRGYAPAERHEGYVVTVLDSGIEEEAAGWTVPESLEVTGWRAGCACGWRGPVWPRAGWPAADGQPPPAVAGGPGEPGGSWGQWRAHLAQALPELGVLEAAHRLEEARADLDAAVIGARATGTSWERVGAAAGMSRQSAHERWDQLALAALEPVALDGPPQDGPLDAFGAVVCRRAALARRRHGGHPSRAWSTDEQVAVALVLRDYRHLQAIGFSLTGAGARLAATMPDPPRDLAAWADRIRSELNAALASGSAHR